MRKLFGQKSKQKLAAGTSIVMSLFPGSKDDDKQTFCPTAPISTIIDSAEDETDIHVDEMQRRNDSGDRSTKLCVVVSDVDSGGTLSISSERTDRQLLSVDECEMSDPPTLSPSRPRSSTTCSSQNYLRPRDHSSKKILKDAIRRRSWMVFQSNSCPSADVVVSSQPSTSYCRLRRYRLSLSEPNLASLQIHSSARTTSRTSSATAAHNASHALARRPSTRRSNLSSLHSINLKHTFRKQLSPRTQTISTLTADPNQELHALEDDGTRRWSVTSVPSSSGYGTTSPPSSQYSSFERLQHQHHICTCKHQSEANPLDDFQHLESRSISMSMLDANISSVPGKLMFTPDQDLNTMAHIYKGRYPKAKVQMEERLQNFIETYKLVDKFEYCSDGSARFIHNQIVELAKDCLDKSTNELITTLYFNEMADNLERLLLNAQEKCPQAVGDLQAAVRKLLLITARSARLLECLHFDPENFMRTLEEVESQAKTLPYLTHDIPKYICSQLNMERNPLDLIDGLQVGGSDHPDGNSRVNISSSDNENESFTESNYLTITPNTPFPPLDRSSSMKNPCEEDFEVLKLISNGAYGAVHLVKHRQTQERRAMKKISKTHLILRNQIEQAFVERDIMTFTDNPFVVALLCTFETKNHLCLVMEYVEGGDVATLLKNIGGPLNIDIARMYFAETTLAVEYLHSYGIIHRDLKPDNLLITAIGHIKLTDFGLSKIGLMSLTTNFYEKHIDKDTKTFNDKQICGTPSYIAPEVILRQGYGKAVDWWSMGIILYEFLVGIPPFTGNTPDELFANVINGEIDWTQFVSDPDEDGSQELLCPATKNLIEQLLEHDPSKRLGALAGAYEIRSHPFCSCINWSSLLREKADFVPVLESPDDTSYFDTRQDRYKHSDDDEESLPTTNNDSDSLFASFSSVSIKYVSELSGNHKQRKQDTGSASSRDVSHANSCTDSSNSIHIDSPNDFQALSTSKSMIDEKVESFGTQGTFDSDTFEPIPTSSDESESSSQKVDSSACLKTTDDEAKKPSLTPTKHYKQRKTSGKLHEQQYSVDSGDDNQQEQNRYRHHRKTRIPRTLSPIQPKSTCSLLTPTVSISNDNSAIPCPSYKSGSYTNQQQQSFSGSLSKSFSSSSSSSSPPPICISNQDDRSCRQPYRHNMAVSPLERDTTLKANQQDAYSSSTLSPIHSMKNNLHPPIIIHRGPRSFGFTLRAVKVFHGNTDYYTTQHVIVAVHGPAEEAGLKPNDVITHVNERPVAGLLHSEVVKLILSGSETLSIRAMPSSETQIRTGGRRRSPSKQKLRYDQQSEKKLPTTTTITHQSHCQKHSANPPGSNTSNPSKKHSQNTSLFRRLSERKVARDIEAAAAAAGVPLTMPKSCTHTTTTTTTTPSSSATTTNTLSSSLPLLLYNDPCSANSKNNEQSLSHHQLNPSEWPPLNQLTLTTGESDPSRPTVLPSIIRQKSQTSISSLVKCAPTSPEQPTHSSLCKTISEPPRSVYPNSTSNSDVQYSFRRHQYYTPSNSSSRRTLVRQKSMRSPPPSFPAQSRYLWNDNLTWNAGSSASSPSTRQNVDSDSSNPVTVSPKLLSRRR